MQNHFSTLDWLVLVAYFAGTMSIGFYFYRKSRSTEGFTAAGRSLPGWVCGLSIFATYLSSISYLALPGKSFAADWNPFVFSLSIPIATWIAVSFFLPYYRNSNEVSAYALLEHRFGTWARVYTSLFYLLTQIARMGVVMYLMALPLAVIFGWDIRLIIVITGISVTVYSFVGGIVAVIWADAIQAIVLMAGALICLVIMLFGVEGGPATVIRVAGDNHKFFMGPYSPSISQPTFWVVLVYGLFINLQNFGIDQSYIQRYIAASSDREARKSLWFGGLLYVPVSALFFLIGTTLFVYYSTQEDEIPEVKRIVAQQRLMQEGIEPQYVGAEGESPAYRADYLAKLDAQAAELTNQDIGDRVFPHFIAKHLPPGMTGLLIAAVFAAAMSTVSTSLNSSATLLMRDYYQRFFNQDASEKQCMGALYVSTVLWGVLGTGMALALVKLTDSALDMWWTMSSIFSGGMLGLFLLGMISRRAKNPAAVTAVLIGALVIAWMVFSPRYWGVLDGKASVRQASVNVSLEGENLDGQLSIGERILIPITTIDPRSGEAVKRQAAYQITSVAGAGRRLTLDRPFEHPTVQGIPLTKDNLWYHLRSPFHSFLVIVVGSLSILLVGMLVSRFTSTSRS